MKRTPDDREPASDEKSEAAPPDRSEPAPSDRSEPIGRGSFLRRSAALASGIALGAALEPGVAAAATAAAGANEPPNVPEWMQTIGAGVDEHPYGMPSQFEKEVIRRNVPWLTATTQSSVSFTPLQDLEGIITPNGVCFTRNHGGTPDVDPAQHRLMLHGLVERPLVLTVEDVMRFPAQSRIYFLECPANGGMEWKGAQMQGVQFTHGMVHCCEWTGVKLSVLLDEIGVKPEATWMLAEGADAAAMTRSIPIEKARDDVMIAWSQNGERLRPENGYPIRLIVPGWQGNQNVKWLRRLKFGDKPWHTREETSKYTDLMPDGKAREFDWVLETKSVITAPCPEKPLKGHGFHEISGLAWSGRGKIARVDVSFDGGINWKTAALNEPVFTKCLTRFRIPWQWDGSTALLQSRAIDETGYVQPTIDQLRAVRGVNAVYNKNSIHTWRVNPNGTIDNVQTA
jgi:sulfane dehydrogenase subunit SoxC